MCMGMDMWMWIIYYTHTERYIMKIYRGKEEKRRREGELAVKRTKTNRPKQIDGSIDGRTGGRDNRVEPKTGWRRETDQ